MICSSVNRFFMSNLLRGKLDSKVRRYSNRGDVPPILFNRELDIFIIKLFKHLH